MVALLVSRLSHATSIRGGLSWVQSPVRASLHAVVFRWLVFSYRLKINWPFCFRDKILFIENVALLQANIGNRYGLSDIDAEQANLYYSQECGGTSWIKKKKRWIVGERSGGNFDLDAATAEIKNKNINTAYGRWLKKRKSVPSGSQLDAVLPLEFISNLDIFLTNKIMSSTFSKEILLTKILFSNWFRRIYEVQTSSGSFNKIRLGTDFIQKSDNETHVFLRV